MRATKTIADLWESVGGLSDPSKMPGYGWGISPTSCKRGSKLRKIAGTVCNICFACKGRYVFETATKAHEKRLMIYVRSPGLWAQEMYELLSTKKMDKHFRWFDSGDVQSVTMLECISCIARMLPGMKFWLPTREVGILRDARELGYEKPDNLTIRISADMVGNVRVNSEYPTSSVDAERGWLCPASRGEVTCKQAGCYKCWDETVQNVDYKSH